MKKDVSNSSQKLINIRRGQRSQQLQQRINSMRFSGEAESQIAGDELNYSQFDRQITLDEFWRAIDDSDIGLLYLASMSADFDIIEAMQRNVQKIVEIICMQLTTPKGILALGNFSNSSSECVEVVFRMNKLSVVISGFRKMAVGSKQQGVYLWCLCKLTENSQFVDVQQLFPIYQPIQRLFRKRLQQGKQDNDLIRLIKNISQCCSNCIGFTEDMLVQLCRMFWKSVNLINIINLYVMSCNLITRKLFKKSTEILINAIVVILKGRNKIPNNMDLALTTRDQLLLSCFKSYNQIWQEMDKNCYFQFTDGQRVTTSLHNYFLDYQKDIFVNMTLRDGFYQFLLEFCKNGPIQKIVNIWNETGTLEYLSREMTVSADLCYLTLLIFNELLQGGNEVSNLHVVQLLSLNRLEQQLQSVLMTYHDPSIMRMCNKLLELLEKE